MIKEVSFFAYAVGDMKKARQFYEGFLGLKPNKDYEATDDASWIEYNIGATTLGIGYAPGMWEPSTKGASAALEVINFERALTKAKEANIPIVMGPNDYESCQMVVLADPDGNRITLHKRKAKTRKASAKSSSKSKRK